MFGISYMFYKEDHHQTRVNLLLTSKFSKILSVICRPWHLWKATCGEWKSPSKGPENAQPNLLFRTMVYLYPVIFTYHSTLPTTNQTLTFTYLFCFKQWWTCCFSERISWQTSTITEDMLVILLIIENQYSLCTDLTLSYCYLFFLKLV